MWWNPFTDVVSSRSIVQDVTSLRPTVTFRCFGYNETRSVRFLFYFRESTCKTFSIVRQPSRIRLSRSKLTSRAWCPTTRRSRTSSWPWPSTTTSLWPERTNSEEQPRILYSCSICVLKYVERLNVYIVCQSFLKIDSVSSPEILTTQSPSACIMGGLSQRHCVELLVQSLPAEFVEEDFFVQIFLQQLPGLRRELGLRVVRVHALALDRS